MTEVIKIKNSVCQMPFYKKVYTNFQNSTLNIEFLLPLLEYTMEGLTIFLISKLYSDSTGIRCLIQK